MARPKKVEAALDQPEAESAQEKSREPIHDLAVEPVQPQAQTYVTVSPVYGPMHHPFQNIRIDGATPVEMDNWIEVQIEAGKLTVTRTPQGT